LSKGRLPLVVLLTALALPLATRRLAAEVPTPEAHFGFRMGADGRLATADDIEKYFDAVASQSDRVKIVDIGTTTEGHRTIAAIVSAPDNIRNLERIRAANQRLADPRTLPADEARQIVASHKAVLAIGGGIHASEVGATQSANELLYWLATAGDAVTLDILQNVVVVVIPSLNPDGHRLVVDWYNKQKGTPYDGGPMPWLYHKYAGHDINRDAFMMNVAESRNLSRFFYTNWHPQVFLTMHQLETNGPRFSAPPNVDPIDRNYDPIIWREAGLLGSAMTLELERDHHSGVVSNAIYDYYWPGYEDSAPLGHNTVCLLTEVAGVRVATPVTVSARELRDSDRGAPDYNPRVNFPNPWPGGTWRLRDIVDYELSAVRGLLRAVALYREPIVQNFYDMGARAIEAGYEGGPSAFILAAEQRDPSAVKKLEELLLQGGVEIHRALEPFRADGDAYPAGVDIILMAQPYRAYVKTLLERQNYPGTRGAGGLPEQPYDVTGWTLPAQMGVDIKMIARPFDQPAMSRLTTATIAPAQVWADRTPSYYVVDARGNGGALAANRLLAAGLAPAWLTGEVEARGFKYGPGSLLIAAAKTAPPVLQKIAAELGLRVDGLTGKLPTSTRPVPRSRVGLYKSWIDNVDEGWTRWLLEQYEFSYKSITDADVRAGNLRTQFDVIILPSLSPERIAGGLSQDVVPAGYAGGLGDEGGRALKTFVESGGTLVSLDQAGGFAISALALPVRDVTRGIKTDTFFGPGSIVRVEVDPAQPLAYGMSPHTAGFFVFSSAYETLSSSDTTTAARFGDKDLLLSGWLEGEQTIAGRSAVVQVNAGTGRVILMGFPVQHRAQSLATFRLLFNAILTSR
jgi:Zinc carboxypeptidase